MGVNEVRPGEVGGTTGVREQRNTQKKKGENLQSPDNKTRIRRDTMVEKLSYLVHCLLYSRLGSND